MTAGGPHPALTWGGTHAGTLTISETDHYGLASGKQTPLVSAEVIGQRLAKKQVALSATGYLAARPILVKGGAMLKKGTRYGYVVGRNHFHRWSPGAAVGERHGAHRSRHGSR